MNLRERLTKIAEVAIKEGVESSKDIINSNIVPSFEDMGMANVQPGEFAQGEITDKQNLVNKGDMANDTDFNKEGECPINAAIDAVADMLDDLVDISAPDTDATLEIVKTTGEKHGEDHNCPECEHKHHPHHGSFGESALKEEGTPLFMQSEVLTKLYNDWKKMLKAGRMPEKVKPDVIEDIRTNGIDPRHAGVADYVCSDINCVGDKFLDQPNLWNSMIDQLVKDTQNDPALAANMDADNKEWLPNLKVPEMAMNYGESVMGKIITKALGGRSCEQYLRDVVPLTESDFAAPKNFTPDLRVSASAVLNALKQEIGEGSEGIHVDADIDERKNNCYKVSQVDSKKLPKTLKVDTTELKLDGNTYYAVGPTDEYPLNK